MTTAPVGGITARAYAVPTDVREADGTFAWTGTTLVVATVQGGGHAGLGYTYGAGAAASLVAGALAEAIEGLDALDVPPCHRRMVAAMRNVGRPGVAATAISALDVVLWDLKANLPGMPLASLLGRARRRVLAYGSGGFTTHDDARLTEQCGPARALRAGVAPPHRLRRARLRHLEWFHDHVRIERMLFDGAPVVRNGTIMPDMPRPGLGLEFKTSDAERYAA